ncbi:hypothetical protein FKP32DRAFT_551543 [Trametes sanguinea]|nr:hypothetical protein FKP32DRAFT_551543 [Trametes sanguinea]
MMSSPHSTLRILPGIATSASTASIPFALGHPATALCEMSGMHGNASQCVTTRNSFTNMHATSRSFSDEQYSRMRSSQQRVAPNKACAFARSSNQTSVWRYVRHLQRHLYCAEHDGLIHEASHD